ncbi:unnamed protein product [Sphagnum tenellum]
MDVGRDGPSQVSSMNSSAAGSPPAPNKVALITYKRRTGSASRMRRTLDTHTSSTKAAETDKGSREPVHRDLFSSKSTCLYDELSTMWKSSSVVRLKRTMAPKRAIGQYFLDLGQADFSHTTCPSCGLVYARGEYTDEKLHTSFHKNQVQGIQFRGWQHERVAIKLSSKGDRIIYVRPGDPTFHLYKVQEVVRVMEQEMDLVPGWLWQQHCKVYLFISASKKIVGCILCEPIKCAFPIVTSHWQNAVHPSQPCAWDMSQRLVPALDVAVDTNPGELKGRDIRGLPSALPLSIEGMNLLGEGQSRNVSGSCRDLELGNFLREKKPSSIELAFGNWKFRREVVQKKRRCVADQEDFGGVVFCSKVAVPAVCGVRGIWVSCSERRKGIASHLLDAMRTTFCFGLTLQTSQCAFSQPTPDGQAFAARYCHNPSFLVYQPQ